ncbi:MAG: hypothetical protein WKG01_20060 [Kofleriaceae bacterium]
MALDPDTILPKYARGIGKVRFTQRNYQAGDERALERAILATIGESSAA